MGGPKQEIGVMVFGSDWIGHAQKDRHWVGMTGSSMTGVMLLPLAIVFAKRRRMVMSPPSVHFSEHYILQGTIILPFLKFSSSDLLRKYVLPTTQLVWGRVRWSISKRI